MILRNNEYTFIPLSTHIIFGTDQWRPSLFLSMAVSPLIEWGGWVIGVC